MTAANADKRAAVVAWLRERTLGDWAFATLLTLGIVGACAPLLAFAHAPLQDLPQHLAAVRVLGDFHVPEFRFTETFERRPFQTQYVGFYGLVLAFKLLLPLDAAMRVVICLVLASIPIATLGALRAVEGSRWLALLTLPLLWNVYLVLGFLNFLAAIPFMLWGIAIAVRMTRSPTPRWRDAAAFTGVSLAAFLMHIVPFGLLMLTSTLIAMQGSIRSVALRWAAQVPTTVLTLIWLARSSAGASTTASVADSAAPAWPLSARLRELSSWMLDTTPTEGGEHALVALALALGVLWLVPGGAQRDAVGAGDAVAERARVRVAAMALVAAAFYFVLPLSHEWVWPIAPRFALLATVLAIVATPRPSRVALAAALVLTSVSTWHSQSTAWRAAEGFQDEVGAIDDVAAAVPEGSRVAALIFEPHAQAVRFAPFIHYGAKLQAMRGGAVMFTFADFPQSPFVFREDNRPPRVPPRWEWTPGNVDPAGELGWYDYVVTRGGPGRIARQPEAFEAVYDDGRWRVWRRVSAEREDVVP